RHPEPKTRKKVMPTARRNLCARMRARSANAVSRHNARRFVLPRRPPRCGTPVAPARCGVPGMNADRFRASPAVRASVSTDGLVLLDVEGGLVLASNPVGARIWQ